MSNLKKKSVFLLMTLLVTLCTTFPLYAGGQPRWSYLTMIRSQMDIEPENQMNIVVDCSSDPRDVTSLTVTCELQQLDGSWKTIKSWTESNDSNSIHYEKQYGIYNGYSYRTKITAKAYQNGVLLESETVDFDYGYYQ